MNTKNNRRRKESQQRIQAAFVTLLEKDELKNITVSDIIKLSKLNRSTFYANYTDIYDLADQTKQTLEADFSHLFSDYDDYSEHNGALRMFSHIKENQLFYKTYFKLCYNDQHLVTTLDPRRTALEEADKNLKYRIEFFRNGLNAIIKMWLADGCRESPEEMANVLKQEYRGR